MKKIKDGMAYSEKTNGSMERSKAKIIMVTSSTKVSTTNMVEKQSDVIKLIKKKLSAFGKMILNGKAGGTMTICMVGAISLLIMKPLKDIS